MALSPENKLKLMKAVARALARYVRFVHRTSEIIIEPENSPERVPQLHPFIFAMWHGQFLMLPTLHEGAFRVSAMVARHTDAEVIGEMLGKFGIEVVRGAGAGSRKRDRGGASALRTAIRVLESGSTFAMTADVPPGPARRAGLGIVTLAKYTGRPIVAFAPATRRFIALPTWSRLTINLPYSRLAFVMGEPIYVPSDADDETLERCRAAVDSELNRVTRRAYELAGANLSRATPRKPLDRTSPAVPVGTLLRIYRGATSLMRVTAPALLALRRRQGKEDPSRVVERYGQASVARPDGLLMWIHAASVGETNAILPLIDRLQAMRPGLQILLTTGTITSASLAARRLPKGAIHQFVPLDTPEYVRSFLDHWQPDLSVFTESEIWPNLILETSERGIPLALVNARMSGRSAARWRRFSAISRPLFSRFSVVLSQNEGLARQFTELGVRNSVSCGNLKIDAPPPPVDTRELERLRAALEGRPVLVAASTHEGEELIIAEAHQELARRVPGVCTIIAPRHPERGTGLAEVLRARGLNVAQRASGSLPVRGTDIYIADTIGELGTLYALTGLAFIGGSLVPHGGQNPIEAVGHGAAVLTGPHSHNFRDVYRAILRHKGAREVRTAEELAAVAAALLTNEAELETMRSGARTALLSLAGALEHTAEALSALLPPAVGVARAS